MIQQSDRGGDETITAYTLTTGPLLGVARQAYERMNAAPSDRESFSSDALVAIVFAAAAVEAFANEIAALASPTSRGPAPEPVASLGRLLDELEETRASVNLKFLVISSVLAGSAYDKGAQPYQDFALLIKLRNEIVHLKPVQRYAPDLGGRYVPVDPPLLRQLRAKQLVADPDELNSGNFASWISTRAMARWAHNSAVAMVQSVLDMAPPGVFRDELEWIYQQDCTPVT